MEGSIAADAAVAAALTAAAGRAQAQSAQRFAASPAAGIPAQPPPQPLVTVAAACGAVQMASAPDLLGMEVFDEPHRAEFAGVPAPSASQVRT